LVPQVAVDGGVASSRGGSWKRLSSDEEILRSGSLAAHNVLVVLLAFVDGRVEIPTSIAHFGSAFHWNIASLMSASPAARRIDVGAVARGIGKRGIRRRGGW
jgi:hypothetical protein